MSEFDQEQGSLSTTSVQRLNVVACAGDVDLGEMLAPLTRSELELVVVKMIAKFPAAINVLLEVSHPPSPRRTHLFIHRKHPKVSTWKN